MKQDLFSFHPIEVIQDHRLGLIETRVLIALFSFRGKNTNTCWPSREAISKRCGYTENAISKALTKLVKKGWLIRKQHRGPNTFEITVPKVAESETVAELETVSESALNSGRIGNETVAESATPELTITNQRTISSEKTKINSEKKNKKPRVFIPPDTSEVSTYAAGLGYQDFDSDAFVDHYESVGWFVGKKKMVDWKAAVRGWNRRNKQYRRSNGGNANKNHCAEDIGRAYQAEFGKPPPVGKSTEEVRQILAQRRIKQPQWYDA